MKRKVSLSYFYSTPKRVAATLAVLIAVAAAIVLPMVLRKEPAQAVPPTVEVVAVPVRDVNIYGEYVGRIRAQQFVEVRARVEGYLQNMLFTEGAYIEIGRASCRERVCLYV